MAKILAVLPLLLLASACSRNPSDELARLSEEYVNTTLSFSPATATGVGLHKYQKRNLNDELDDLSPANLDRQRQFLRELPHPPRPLQRRQPVSRR